MKNLSIFDSFRVIIKIIKILISFWETHNESRERRQSNESLDLILFFARSALDFGSYCLYKYIRQKLATKLNIADGSTPPLSTTSSSFSTQIPYLLILLIFEIFSIGLSKLIELLLSSEK